MRLVLATAIAFFASSGCYTVNADLPGTWRRVEPAEDIVVVGRVDQRHTHVFLLFGLAPQPERSVFAAPLVRAVEASGGDGVANVVIDSEFTVTDAVISGVTLGMVAPRSYRVRAAIDACDAERAREEVGGGARTAPGPPRRSRRPHPP